MTSQPDIRDTFVESSEWPEPLREGNDEVALLLRGESQRRLEPGRPFFTIPQKRQQRQWRNISLAAACGALATALLVGGAIPSRSSGIAAEPVSSVGVGTREQGETEHREPSKRSAPRIATDFSGPAGVLAEREDVDASTDGGDDARLGLKEMLLLPMKKSGEAAPDPRKVEAPAGGSDCGLLSRSGKYAQALQCFRVKSLGDGTSAEIGFLEMARIQRRALDDNSAALETLENYQARFPHGTLSWEADQLKQELLRKQTASALSGDDSISE